MCICVALKHEGHGHQVCTPVLREVNVTIQRYMQLPGGEERLKLSAMHSQEDKQEDGEVLIDPSWHLVAKVPDQVSDFKAQRQVSIYQVAPSLPPHVEDDDDKDDKDDEKKEEEKKEEASEETRKRKSDLVQFCVKC